MDTTGTLLPVACRFVPYDQWLVTHVDPQWKITHLKQWFLSKCFPTNLPPPIPPRHRPVSPITFASTRSLIERSPIEDHDWDIGKYHYEGDSDDSAEGVRYRSQHKRQKLSISSIEIIPNNRDYQASQYTLLTFSTGQVLEDDFKVLWYDLRSYELLELHHVGADLRLPRDVMLEYVQPSFEAKVRALRLVLRERRAGRESREFTPGRAASKGPFAGRVAKSRSEDGGKRTGGPFIDLEREIEDHKEKDKGKKKRKPKQEWRDRLLVIKNGVMTLCKDRNDAKPQSYSLSSITALQGAERIKKVTSIALESPVYDRVVCCKFNTALARQGKSSQGSSPTSYSPVDDPLPAIGFDETESEAEENPKGEHERPTGEWIALDMLDDNAYASILRILHRSTLQPLPPGFALTPRFLPAPASGSPSPSASISLLGNATSEMPVSALSQRPSAPYEPSYSSSLRPAYASTPRVQPYPEWRMNVTNRAQLAGVGDIGRALKWAICGDESFLNNNQDRSVHPKVAEEQEGASELKAAAVLTDEPFELDLRGDGADFDETASDSGSEAEWEGWIGDLERQQTVAETVFQRRRDQQQSRDTSIKEHTVQHERQALEPTGVVSTASRGSPSLSSPSSSESLGPGQQHPPTIPRHIYPSPAFGSSELANIKRDGGVFVPRPSSPLTLEGIYASVGMLTGRIANISASVTDPQALDGSQDVRPEGRKRSSTITPAVGKVLRKGKNRSKEETQELDDSVANRKASSGNPNLALVSHTALNTDAGVEDDRRNRTPTGRALRHAWSSSSLGPGMRSLSLGTSPPRDETEWRVHPDHLVGSGKRTKNGLGLVRGVSVRAEKLMKGLDNAMDFVDGK